EAVTSLDAVIAVSDAMFFLISVPNLLGIYYLARVLPLDSLRHRYRVSVGALSEGESHHQVSMGTHRRTTEQVAAETHRNQTEEPRVADLHRQLAEAPDFPVRADHHDEDLASPMGETDYDDWAQDPEGDGDPQAERSPAGA